MKYLIGAGLALLILKMLADEQQLAAGVPAAGGAAAGAPTAGAPDIFNRNPPPTFVGPDPPGRRDTHGHDQAPRPTIVNGFVITDGPTYEPYYPPGVIRVPPEAIQP